MHVISHLVWYVCYCRRVELLLKQGVDSVLYSALSANSDDIVQVSATLLNTLVTAAGKQPTTEPWSNILSKLADSMFKVSTDQVGYIVTRHW